jgi:hypothetical protein
MDFTLHYRGHLRANGSPQHKHEIRQEFHKQLKNLWTQPPLEDGKTELLQPAKPEDDDHLGVVRSTGPFNFAPLVSTNLWLVAHLHITLLRPEPPGKILTQAGDIDNRLKTLLDALQTPKEEGVLPSNISPCQDEVPFFYCLLEDDNLVTGLSIRTDRLLYPSAKPTEVEMQIHVKTKTTSVSFGDISLA